MPPRRNQRPLDDVYEREMEERLMARVEQRLGQVVDQLADRMNDMMNQRRRGAEGSDFDNPFFSDDGSASEEESRGG
ncbi:hypothetical protein E3N88_13817 [Mikania micrantha]|uniref:Uncharacterized protein n=1 Tax=Mikania micrantha TaxID=192012 RepID=A0A5N6P0W2_9ASTR|nr:hypothetical protein E3N88_13817 [Mikania micrantha]